MICGGELVRGRDFERERDEGSDEELYCPDCHCRREVLICSLLYVFFAPAAEKRHWLHSKVYIPHAGSIFDVAFINLFVCTFALGPHFQVIVKGHYFPPCTSPSLLTVQQLFAPHLLASELNCTSHRTSHPLERKVSKEVRISGPIMGIEGGRGNFMTQISVLSVLSPLILLEMSKLK